MAQVVQQMVEQLRERIGSIRDPDSEEFPTIAVRGTTIEDLRLTIEGSDTLLARVKEVLSDDITSDDDENTKMEQQELVTSSSPRVFVSWGSPD